MLSTFFLLPGHYSGQNELTVGTPIANRIHPQPEPVLGLIANILIVRTVFDPQQSFKQLVSDIHCTVTDMQQHQQIPFEQLVDQLIVEREPSRTPQFQVMLAVQHFATADQLSGTGTIEHISLPDWTIAVKCDLSLGIDNSANPLTGAFEYPVALFRADTIELLHHHYVQILEQVVAQPDILLQDIGLLAPGSRH